MAIAAGARAAVLAFGLVAGGSVAAGQSQRADDLALELIGQVTNSAAVTPSTSSQYGYVAYLRGLPIFSAEPQSESTALFTFSISTTTTRVINSRPLRRQPRGNDDDLRSLAQRELRQSGTFRDGTPILVAAAPASDRGHDHRAFSTLNVNTITSSARFSVGSATVRLGDKGTVFQDHPVRPLERDPAADRVHRRLHVTAGKPVERSKSRR